MQTAEYFLEHYNIDPGKVYLHGMSGGGETGSLVMGKRPDLYTAYLMTASKCLEAMLREIALRFYIQDKEPINFLPGQALAEHPGTLEKLEYQTWESFSYAERSQELTKTVCIPIPLGWFWQYVCRRASS